MAKAPDTAVGQVLSRARQSLKILESLDLESIKRARTFVRAPLALKGSDPLLVQLKRLGVATWEELFAELEALRARVRSAESPAENVPAAKADSPAAAPESPLPNG